MDFLYYDRFIDKRENRRYDLTPIFKDPIVFQNLINDLSHPFKQSKIETIAGIESFGFILGAGMAQLLNKGFLPIRKGGKLACIPELVDRVSIVDYSGIEKTLELKREFVKKGERFLLVDEWADTCAQMNASIHLIESNGGIIEGISLIGIEKNSHTEKLMKRYNVHAIGIAPYG
jgi:adenine phosphoribosyltransferase